MTDIEIFEIYKSRKSVSNYGFDIMDSEAGYFLDGFRSGEKFINEKKDAEIKTLKEHYSQSENLVAQTIQKNRQLQSEIKQAHIAYDKLCDSLTIASDEISTLKQEVEAKNETIDNLVLQINNIDSKWIARLEMSQSIERKLQSEISTLKQEIEALKFKV